MNKYILRIGFIDFHNPTLLIIGEAESLNWLAESMATRQPLDFATIPFVKQENVCLLLEPTEGAGILTQDGKSFFWKVSLLESQDFSVKLRGLASCQTPAHTYLDSAINNTGVEVVASIGEYDDLVFP